LINILINPTSLSVDRNCPVSHQLNHPSFLANKTTVPKILLSKLVGRIPFHFFIITCGITILLLSKGTCSPGTSCNWRIRDITPEENSRWSPWQCLVPQIEFHDLRFGLHSVGSDQRGVIQKELAMPYHVNVILVLLTSGSHLTCGYNMQGATAPVAHLVQRFAYISSSVVSCFLCCCCDGEDYGRTIQS
jgi:hypothetical protein